MQIKGEDDNIFEKLWPRIDNKFILKEQNIENDHGNSIGKNLDTGNYISDNLSKYTS